MNDSALPKVQGVLSSHVYGPVLSRRYGVSLGVNVLPNDLKLCSYNCCYCECGWTRKLDTRADVDPALFPPTQALLAELATRLDALRAKNTALDAITFAGNGEPTLHPDFLAIAHGSRALRDRLAPHARLILLSNATTLDDADILAALDCFDEAVMKLDAGRQDTFRRIDIPHKNYTLDAICNALRGRENVTIQTLFLTGRVDNTTPEELDAWMARLRDIGAKRVQLYTIERPASDRTVRAVPVERLEAIAARVRDELGIEAGVFS